MNVLVTGGAGYVGSHTVRALMEENHTVTVLDTLEKGHDRAVSGAELVVGDSGNRDLVGAIIKEKKIQCVMHFAAYAEVGESMSVPEKYYSNNTAATANLIRACVENGVKKFVFSSTCAVYGQPEIVPLTEDLPRNPLSVYGHSKLLSEFMMEQMSENSDFRFVALRYFNAAGAHRSGEIGEDHAPESHLIPIVLQVAQGKRPNIKIFGTDYPTPDGTCIRDYIHVSDLARGHLAAMDYLFAGGESVKLNIGTGDGYSVREIIDVCRKVTGHEIPAIEEARRAGDPPRLFANASKITELFGWKPVESDIEQLVASAWKWHSSHPNGYRS